MQKPIAETSFPPARYLLALAICIACGLWCSRQLLAKPPAGAAPASEPSSSTPVDSTGGRAPITRGEVLRIAESYVKHEWRATEANVFHGFSKKGVRIDTPDAKWWAENGWDGEGWHADGRVNVGVPYCWGGENTLEEFDKHISEGRPAGHVFKDVNDPPASTLPVGVDCSGFVSRCWRLKERRSTHDLGKDCRRLPSFDDLRPGDAINKPNHHVVLFKEWIDQKHKRMRVYEATFPRVAESEYDRAALSTDEFVPLRYLGIIDN